MSIPNLPVDFKDDILSSLNQKRKYTEISNPDGTKSFEDSTEYDQVGSEFGAREVNQTNGAINNIYDERILTLEEAALVTEPGFFVDAQVITELNGNLITIQSGNTTVSNVSNVYKYTEITFSTSFTQTPAVCICLRGASANRYINVVSDSVTKTGFTFSAYVAQGTASVGVMWIAIGK